MFPTKKLLIILEAKRFQTFSAPEADPTVFSTPKQKKRKS